MNRQYEELLTTHQAASFLKLTHYTLQQWRSTGRYGLPYVKMGRKVFYKRKDLEEFIEKRMREHT